MKHTLLIILICSICDVAFGQKQWTLLGCVDYAIKNNISLTQANNQVAVQSINLKQSKANVLPSFDASSNVDMRYGRSIDGNTNAVSFDQNLSNGYGLNAWVSLFQGLVKYNTIAFNRYLLSAQEQNANYQRNQLVFSVLANYYTVLYSRGLSNVAQKQVDLAYLQLNRMQKLVDVGKESPLTVQNLKSQWANDKLSLTQAQNNANSTLLDLKQLLRINAQTPFELDTLLLNSLVVTLLPSVDSVFTEAKNKLPEIKQQEFLLSASEKELAIAKGFSSPQLSMSAGMGTAFYTSSNENVVSPIFTDQIRNNQNQYVALGLSIPIFNGASTYSKIKRKQIAVINQQLQLEKQKDDLYAEIWKAINDVESAANEYQSAIELHDFSKLDFANMTKKLEKGMASATDYEVAKQRFVSAEASLLKAKLIYMMRNQMLRFYMTGNWAHL